MAPSFPNWPKTKEGCARQIRSVVLSYERDFAGGGAFGYDWPTFRLNSPERYERVRALQKLFGELPWSDGSRLPR